MQENGGVGRKYLPEPGWRRVLVCAAYVALALAFIYFTAAYFIDWFLPFLAAWVLAWLLRGPIGYINKKTGTSKRFLGIFFMLILLSALAGGIFMLINRVYYELGRLISYVGENLDSLPGQVFGFFDELERYIPFLSSSDNSELVAQMKNRLSELAFQLVGTASAKLPSLAAALIAMLPRVLLFAVIFIMAAFYTCADFDRINSLLISYIPPKARELLRRIKGQAASAVLSYVRAYLTLMLYTFAELLCGFLALGIDYALTLAVLIAVLDALPVIGAGAILLPWAAVLLIRGNYYVGFGLLIIYAVVTLARRIIEPRVVGNSIGLHPLVTLVSMYAGYKAMGLGGMFLFPIAAILLKNMLGACGEADDGEGRENAAPSPPRAQGSAYTRSTARERTR